MASRFVDFATVFLRSGKGGDGIVSFCRERFRPYGGPDGGDGGTGGSVICELDPQRSSLEHLTHQRHYRAGDGGRGDGGGRHGANGADCLISLPAGAVIHPYGEASVLCEVTAEAPRHILLQGGSGGYGNTRFKTAHNRVPRFARDGGVAEEIRVDIELRLMADVGFLGLPNAGKSSLLRALSRALPEVGAYPFTSLKPTLGVVLPPHELRAHQPLTAVDIPGVIDGAAAGRGLGNTFLRHLSRVRVITIVLSLEALDGITAAEQLAMLVRELRVYDARLLSQVALVIANKEDCSGSEAELASLKQVVADGMMDQSAGDGAVVGRQAAGGVPMTACSATHGTGIEQLRAALYQHYDEIV